MLSLGKIPKVDKILEHPSALVWLRSTPRKVVVGAIRSALESLRRELLGGETSLSGVEMSAVIERVEFELKKQAAFSLRRVVNGTGVVIHTNLGRSPLPEKVLKQLVDISCHYSNLELNLETGERGSRYSHLEPLICELTGAEAALVVNNNAAAVLLALSSLTTGREVIVSRGELVEIGGSFRIPDVMKLSGAMLREVGTTNRTHLQDYREALSADTGLLLKVHCSNFAMVGFTAEVTAQELALLGREIGIPVMADVGSGNLVELEGLPGQREATIQDFIKAGVDLVTCSGDKLLGGPQIGIIAGRKALVEPMKRHPLLRALRVDKMTLAALEGVMRLYRDERQALVEIPTLRMLTASADELNLRARKAVRWLKRRLPTAVSLSLVKGFSQAGGGALPQLELPTTLIAVTVVNMSANEVEERLRCAATPVIGRIAKGAFLLDLRTILDDDLPLLSEGLSELCP